MTRPISPFSAQIASDLIDRPCNADQITATVNFLRTQRGQDNSDPYQPDDIRAFRASRPSTSMAPALAGLSPRPSGSTSTPYVSDLARALIEPSPSGSTSTPYVSELAHALIEPSKPHDFSRPPLPSGNSGQSQSFTSGGLSQAASAVPSSGLPPRGAAPASVQAAPYPPPSSLSSGPSAVSRTRRRPPMALQQPEHTALMETLPREFNPQHRSCIKLFLLHLEQHDLTWSGLVPRGNTDLRPARLERAVNAAIDEHGLSSSTRAALNQRFGLSLQGKSGIVRLAPEQSEHTTLMNTLPRELSSQYRSCINRFLCHLEQQGLTWSQLVPRGNTDLRPADLEQAVTAGKRKHGLHRNTRTALNRAFGFNLQP